MRPKIYIEGNELDVFDDERVEFKLNIKDFKQFDKTLGSYTQPFSVPASKNNNKVFEHYYNATVSSSFNPNVSRSAVLELNGLPYRTGLIRLEKVDVKGGEAKSYQITFYDDILQLKDLLGKTRLYEIPILDDSGSNIWADRGDRMSGIDNVLNGNSGVTRQRQNAYFTPLISTERFMRYSDDATDNNDLATDPGFVINEFRPALAVQYVIESIEEEFDIVINYPSNPSDPIGDPSTGSSDSNAEEALYIWANREEGKLDGVRKPWELMETNSITSDISGYWDPTGHWFEISNTDGNATNYFVVVIDTSGFEDVEYEVCAYNQTTSTIIEKQLGSGTKEYIFEIDRPSSGSVNYQFYVRTAEPFKIGSSSGVFWADNSSLAPVISVIRLNSFVEPDTGNGARMYFSDVEYTTLGETYTAPGQLPNIRVFDFLVGLAKMFNWVLVANSPTRYVFKTLDQFYQDGNTRDWTQYVDQLNYTARPVDFFGEIKFLYEPNDSVLSDQFYNTVGGGERGYGDLVTTISDINGDRLSPESYEVNVPFTTMIWERPRTNAGRLANFYIANAVDKEGSPTELAPLLMYYNGKATAPASRPVKITTNYDTSTTTDYTTVNQASERTAASTSFNYSLNFGSEINIAGNSADPTGSNTLYNVFYEDFITDLYDVQARQYDFDALLPIGEVLDVELNDTITIGFTKYYINSISVDLTTGKAKLNLRNVIA